MHYVCGCGCAHPLCLSLRPRSRSTCLAAGEADGLSAALLARLAHHASLVPSTHFARLAHRTRAPLCMRARLPPTPPSTSGGRRGRRHPPPQRGARQPRARGEGATGGGWWWACGVCLFREPVSTFSLFWFAGSAHIMFIAPLAYVSPCVACVCANVLLRAFVPLSVHVGVCPCQHLCVHHVCPCVCVPLQAGADPCVVNSEGHTPAQESDEAEVEALLGAATAATAQ